MSSLCYIFHSGIYHLSVGSMQDPHKVCSMVEKTLRRHLLITLRGHKHICLMFNDDRNQSPEGGGGKPHHPLSHTDHTVYQKIIINIKKTHHVPLMTHIQ